MLKIALLLLSKKREFVLFDMKILLITARWIAGDQIGKPCHTQNIVKSLDSVFKDDPNVEYEVKYLSPTEIWSREELCKVMLETECDMILLSPIKHVFVDLKTAKMLGKKLNIIVWDTHCLQTKLRYVNLRCFLKSKADIGVMNYEVPLWDLSKFCNIICIDNGYGEMFPNIYCTFEPMDTQVLYPIKEEEKIYDISFIGSTNEYERQLYRNKLDKLNVKINWIGGRGPDDKQLSHEDWAKAHRKSKIELNFNGNAFLGNRKSRVWEIAACGNMMIATIPDVYKFHTGEWFKDGEHFASIDTSNFSKVIKYYLENSDERIQMAKKMHELYIEKYTPQIWWNNLINNSVG